MYRLLSNGLIGEPCGLPRPSSRFARASMLISTLVRLSTGASSHILNQMQHRPIDDSARYDFRSFGMWKGIK